MAAEAAPNMASNLYISNQFALAPNHDSHGSKLILSRWITASTFRFRFRYCSILCGLEPSFIYSPSLCCARPHPHSPPRPLRRLQQRYLRSSLLSPRSALSFLPPSPSSCGSVGVAARGQRRHPRRGDAGLARPSTRPCGPDAHSGAGGAPCRGVAWTALPPRRG